MESKSVFFRGSSGEICVFFHPEIPVHNHQGNPIISLIRKYPEIKREVKLVGERTTLGYLAILKQLFNPIHCDAPPRMQSSPPGFWSIFRLRDPNLNLHFPLESWIRFPSQPFTNGQASKNKSGNAHFGIDGKTGKVADVKATVCAIGCLKVFQKQTDLNLSNQNHWEFRRFSGTSEKLLERMWALLCLGSFHRSWNLPRIPNTSTGFTWISIECPFAKKVLGIFDTFAVKQQTLRQPKGGFSVSGGFFSFTGPSLKDVHHIFVKKREKLILTWVFRKSWCSSIFFQHVWPASNPSACISPHLPWLVQGHPLKRRPCCFVSFMQLEFARSNKRWAKKCSLQLDSPCVY